MLATGLLNPDGCGTKFGTRVLKARQRGSTQREPTLRGAVGQIAEKCCSYTMRLIRKNLII